MVYKPVNIRGARSLNFFPCFAVNILEMKLETEPMSMVNGYYKNADQYLDSYTDEVKNCISRDVMQSNQYWN